MSFFRKPKTDPLSPDTIPGSPAPGTRTMNNLPLFIGGGVLVIFVLIVAMIMHQRANRPETTAQQESSRTAVGATNFAAELTAPWASGQIIPPTRPTPTPEPDPAPKPEDTKPETPKLVVTPEMSMPDLEPLDRWAMFRERFDSARVTAFEAALKSPTTIQANAPRSAAAQIADTRQRLEATREQLAGMGDPNSLYQARLAALRGELASPADDAGGMLTARSGPSNDVSRYSRSSTWTLPSQVEAPAPYSLQAGFVLPAIMISGIVSDLPGQVMAQVSQSVYDSPTGRHLLIPQGTRLIGTYNSEIVYGQRRVLMAWQRLVFPDGRTLDLQAMPGADASGKAGFRDQVNTHFWRTLRSAFLLSGVVAAVSLSQDNDSGDSDRQRASDALSEALGQTLGSAIAEQLRKNMNVSPTIEIRPGYRFNVMVSKDIVLEGPYNGKKG